MLHSIHLIYIESRYKSCSKPGHTKCSSEPLEKNKDVTKQRCEEMCDENDKCNFIHWYTARFCVLFKTCDKAYNNEAKEHGAIFAKNSCPGTIMIFIHNTVIFYFDIFIFDYH